MKFKLKPYFKNQFPKNAVLVCHSSPKFWLQEIQGMGFQLEDVTVFPVPSSVANELYGCLIIFKRNLKGIDIGRNIYFQNIHNKLYIPENTIVSPPLSLNDLKQVFSENYHVFHPDFGLVELEQEVNWISILSDIGEVTAKIVIPSKSVAVPKCITSLRIEIDEETILKELEGPETEKELIEKLPFDMKKVLKGNQKEIDKFLLYLEKNPEMALRLGISLDELNTSRGARNGSFSFGNHSINWPRFSNLLNIRTSNSGSSFDPLTSLVNFFFNGKNLIFKYMFILVIIRAFIASGELLGFLKFILVIGVILGVIYLLYKPTNQFSHSSLNNRKVNDKYLPIIVIVTILGMAYFFVKFITSDAVDTSISSIFYIIGFFILTLIVVAIIVKLFDLSQQSNRQSGGNSGNPAFIDSDRFNMLRKKYEDLAQEFISKKEYEKAAHVYMKLLKNNYQAAVVLENGNLFQEAATVYLKYCQNKNKAAECYEKGKAYKEAIALYKEFGMTEKVGDLYLLMNDRETANEYFYKVVDDYKAKYQYVKASLILRNKIEDIPLAQSMLLEGWRNNKDSENCLNNYFNNFKDVNQLKKQIEHIYANETPEERLENLLTVLKKEYEKQDALKVTIKDIAYEIVAKRIIQNPHIASELYAFNKKDKNIVKDVILFKYNKKNRN